MGVKFIHIFHFFQSGVVYLCLCFFLDAVVVLTDCYIVISNLCFYADTLILYAADFIVSDILAPLFKRFTVPFKK